MAARAGGSLRWMMMVAVLAAAPVAGQPGDYGLREDSLGVADDAVPLATERVATECDPIGLRVVRDSAELRAIERWPDCRASEFPALGRELYAHVVMMGDCHARFGVEAYRSDSRREYRVVMVKRYGGCRAGKIESWWMRLPPLPEGWSVAFTTRRIQRGDLDR